MSRGWSRRWGARTPTWSAFAAWSLGNLGSAAQAAVPDLARALARDDTNAVVAGALARIGPAAGAAVGVLVDGLHSADADRRWRAARTLGRIGPPAASAVPSLTAALSDSSSLVRLHAARALGRIGPAARPAAAGAAEGDRGHGPERAARKRAGARAATLDRSREPADSSGHGDRSPSE